MSIYLTSLILWVNMVIRSELEYTYCKSFAEWTVIDTRAMNLVGQHWISLNSFGLIDFYGRDALLLALLSTVL